MGWESISLQPSLAVPALQRHCVVWASHAADAQTESSTGAEPSSALRFADLS